MRVFFLFLLIINALIGAWIYLQPVKNHSTVKSMSSKINLLVLLSEAGVPKKTQELIATADPVKSVEKLNIDNKHSSMCYTLGPFKDESMLKQARKLLAEQVQNINVRKREESQQHRYWVYLPVMPSRTQAIKQSMLLAQNEISDYYIVGGGKKKNAISLGHFKEKKHADHRIIQLKKKGFDTEMEVIFRRFDVFWLDFSVKPNNTLSDDVISGYQADRVTLLDRSCD